MKWLSLWTRSVDEDILATYARRGEKREKTPPLREVTWWKSRKVFSATPDTKVLLMFAWSSTETCFEEFDSFQLARFLKASTNFRLAVSSSTMVRNGQSSR